MNRNESGRLTPKQQELVKRLEQIRQSKATVKQETPKDANIKRAEETKRRNADVQQNRQRSQDHREKENKFARPSEEKKKRTKPIRSAAPLQRKNKLVAKKKVQPKAQKESSNLVKQLSSGKSLAQAIALSEVLDQPVSLRRR